MNFPRTAAPLLLFPLALVLLPVARTVEIPLAILSILGVIALYRASRGNRGNREKREKRESRESRESGESFVAVPGRPSWGVLAGLYAALLLPMLLALPDAVALEQSLISTIGTLRYPLSCCALLWFLQDADDPARLQRSFLRVLGLTALVLCLLWSIDGLWQFATGRNVLGYGIGEGYVNGVFGDDDNIKLGLTLALLFPLVFVAALREGGWSAALLATLVVLSVVLLSGKRAAWITAGVELIALLAFYFARGRLGLRAVLLSLVGVLLFASLAYASSAWVRERSDILLAAAKEPSYVTLNQATGKRLPIWGSALRMGRDNWLNGIGPRGFRYAYPFYALEDDAWADPAGLAGGSRASHAHQLLLDLFAETGVSGLIGYLCMVAMLSALWLRADSAAHARALPAAVVLLGMLFPLNTHPGWYSSWFGLLFWFFIGVYLFALQDVSPRKAREAGMSASGRIKA